jgi:serine/threonine protein kinase
MPCTLNHSNEDNPVSSGLINGTDDRDVLAEPIACGDQSSLSAPDATHHDSLRRPQDTPQISIPQHASLSDGARFRIINELGQGGMGVVYAAYDNDLRRTVALKTIKFAQASGPGEEQQVRRFIREARVAARLSHPNIMPVHDLGLWNGRVPYILMPVVGPDSLAALLHQIDHTNAPDQLERLVDIFLKVCEAVDYVHQQKVIHRDLKPSNILIGDYGEVRLVDWGLASIEGAEENEGAPKTNTPDDGGEEDWQTATGDLLGTPQYMSPEQANKRFEVVGVESDIFSLGGILFHILTGRPPNEGNSLVETLRRAKSGERKPTYSMRQWPIPRSLALICDKALANEPRNRFKTVRELAVAVRAARRSHLRSLTFQLLTALVIGCTTSTGFLIGLISSLCGAIDIDWTFWGALLACSLGLAGSATLQIMSDVLGVESRGKAQARRREKERPKQDS